MRIYSAIKESVPGKADVRRKLCVLAAMVVVAVTTAQKTKAADGDAGAIVRLWPDNLFGIDFVDPHHGWITGQNGTVLRTVDGGKSWSKTSTSRNADGHQPELLRRVRFVTRDVGWAVGHRGTIWHSTDGGENWISQFRIPGIYLRDLGFADRKVGWVVGHEGTILATRNGGESWRKQELKNFTGRDLPRLNGISVIDRDRAIIVGEFGVVAITDDGGANWNLVPAPSKTTLTSVAANQTSAVAVGLDGSMLAIVLSGPSRPPITTVDTGTDEHLLAVSIDDNGTGYVVGRSTLLRFGPNGVSALGAAPSIELPYVWFGGIESVPGGGVWAVGMRGLVVRADPSAAEPGPEFKVALTLGHSKEVSVMPNIKAGRP